jgi:hypothetical protein
MERSMDASSDASNHAVCTHPDKLVGHTTENIQRGELLFKRTSAARDDLMAILKQSTAEAEAAEAAGLPDVECMVCERPVMQT